MPISHVLPAQNTIFSLPTQLSWIPAATDRLRDKIAGGVFHMASYLTDPVCKSLEFHRRVCIVDALNPNADFLSNLARKITLYLGMIGWLSLAVFATLPGIALRALGGQIQKEAYLYQQGEATGKILPRQSDFSMLSWNICGIPAGYSITNGGVLPWDFRIDDIADKIIEKDADVNCLYEVFDIQTASYLCEKLKKKGYAHFYFNIANRPIGSSSGILVASKYNIKNPEFTVFPQDSLVGTTKYCNKGVFAFDLESEGRNFARIFATHLQHSEVSQFPTAEEVEARRKQMQVIIDKVNTVRDRTIVVTGDLNLGDQEYNASSWRRRFEKGDAWGPHEKTWGGDDFCARLQGQTVSGPMNLDHTMVVRGTARSIHTSLLRTGFVSTEFKEKALSDHEGLYSRIVV